MKKSIIIIVAMLVAFAATTFAQKLDSTTIGGFVMLQAPTNSGENNFTNRWSVVKFAGFEKNVKIGFQYDLASQCLIEAEGILTYGSFTISAGATFTAAGQITPAPNGLTTEWWREVFMSYSFIENGIGVGFSRDGLNAYLVRGKELSASATFHGFQALWQENHATTLAYEGSLNQLVNPFAGVTFFQKGGSNQYSVMNTVLITKDLSLNYGLDFGRIEEGRIGGCWHVNQYICLKVAYSVRVQKTFAEIVCSF